MIGGQSMDKHKWIKRITIGLFILSLFLVVGYSFVSTNLITGGSSSILYNDTDFILDYHGRSMNNCNKDARLDKTTNTITCVTSYMNDLGDDIYFGFAFINRSYKYDAEVTVNFSVINPDTNDDVTSHFSYDFENYDFDTSGYRVLARNTTEGFIYIYYDKEFEINTNLKYIITFDIKPSGITSEGTAQYLEGEIYKIGDEEFYVIGGSNKQLALLSQYNLNVGRDKYADDPIGIQSSHADGWNHGDVTFTSEYNLYWSKSGANYGNSYPKYIYDENSNLYKYVEDYVSILKNTGANVKGRLLKYYELSELGCSSTAQNCFAAPSWLYSVSYWPGIAFDDSSVYQVTKYGSYNDQDPLATSEGGVRPVIEITLP
jgi:hypothetical protein